MDRTSLIWPPHVRGGYVLKMKPSERVASLNKCIRGLTLLCVEMDFDRGFSQQVQDVWADGYDYGAAFKLRDDCYRRGHFWGVWNEHAEEEVYRYKVGVVQFFYRECNQCHVKEEARHAPSLESLDLHPNMLRDVDLTVTGESDGT